MSFNYALAALQLVGLISTAFVFLDPLIMIGAIFGFFGGAFLFMGMEENK